MGNKNKRSNQQKYSSHRIKLPEMARSGGVGLDRKDTGIIGTNPT